MARLSLSDDQYIYMNVSENAKVNIVCGSLIGILKRTRKHCLVVGWIRLSDGWPLFDWLMKFHLFSFSLHVFAFKFRFIMLDAGCLMLDAWCLTLDTCLIFHGSWLKLVALGSWPRGWPARPRQRRESLAPMTKSPPSHSVRFFYDNQKDMNLLRRFQRK